MINDLGFKRAFGKKLMSVYRRQPGIAFIRLNYDLWYIVFLIKGPEYVINCLGHETLHKVIETIATPEDSLMLDHFILSHSGEIDYTGFAASLDFTIESYLTRTRQFSIFWDRYLEKKKAAVIKLKARLAGRC